MKHLVAVLAAASMIAIGNASAQSVDSHSMQCPQSAAVSGPMPTLPGQGAFGAVQEIVRILEADPATDWSKVNLDALREHLIDMNEVTLRANVAVEPIDGGIRATVTGAGRTLVAIQRMVPAQAHQLDGKNGWNSKTEPLADGVVLIVTSADPNRPPLSRGWASSA